MTMIEKLLDGASAMIMASDLQERIVHANRGWIDRFAPGLDLLEVVGRPWTDFLPEAAHATILKRHQDIVTSRRPQEFDLSFCQPDSGLRVHLAYKFPIIENDEVVAIGTVATDITERRRAQAHTATERDRSERLEAVGELAAGVAHDFNNLLGIIDLNVCFARRDRQDSVKFDQDLGAVQTAIQSGTDLVDSLLTFSRRQPGINEQLVIREIAHDMAEMFKRVLNSSIKIRTVHDCGGAWIVIGDRSQLERTFINLVVNARDAMPDGGRLTITIEKEMVEAQRFVKVRFIDTGEGMSEDVRARVFEPFFTTKPRGKGSGLGLASAYGVVKGMGGRVEVKSRVGQGTTFTLWFPAFDPAEISALSV